MSRFRLLDLVKVVSPIVPEINYPLENVTIDEKVVFTIASALIFMLSQIPVFGLVRDAPLKMTDPFFSFRPLFAMEQGSLLELGLLPVLTSAFAWQLAAGLKLVRVKFAFGVDRELFQLAQKVTSLLLSAVFVVALIVSGYYDPVVRGASHESNAYGSYALIFAQVFGWNVVLTLMVEVLDKGYGFGSGVLCFLALNAATSLVRDVVGLELVSLTPDGVPQTYGVIAYLGKSLLSMELSTIKEAAVGIFIRSGYPSIGMVLIAVATGLAVIVLQNCRLELPVRSNRARGSANIYPIRLLYTGALPVVFAFTVVANVQILLHFLAAAVAPFYPLVASMLASRDASGKLVSGLAFYFSSPASLTASLLSPIRAVVYTGSIVVLASAFAIIWADISGSAPRDIAKQFKSQEIVISGKRDVSITKELSRTIPVAAVSGAVSLAALALVGELLGASGKTVSVTVGIVSAFSVLEDFMNELQQSGGSSQFVGSMAGLK
ncbi:SecY protein [Metschnikowia bicuspidata var. bicuspidata NRRL YB-4993]|uniref:SecY protein n=1 Tax=Metschnikowia bicuspidata var. bicuspidata NRRL YB-4993 TaxID=869754 RepID=A0A1A0HGL1_9ASCO|nr:SecY protein [Metschnikowia bicuspidata var. bicuspidata NRRL YB-4993]OBA23017.1 SecY protein [Metschnikowia bicuspidata var. bicuspidata NRRL YB-4993]